MGTVIYGEEGSNPSIKRFYGGKDKGVMYKFKINTIMNKQEYKQFLKDCLEGLDI